MNINQVLIFNNEHLLKKVRILNIIKTRRWLGASKKRRNTPKNIKRGNR